MLKSKLLIAGSVMIWRRPSAAPWGLSAKRSHATLKSISRQIDMFSLRPYSAAVRPPQVKLLRRSAAAGLTLDPAVHNGPLTIPLKSGTIASLLI